MIERIKMDLSSDLAKITEQMNKNVQEGLKKHSLEVEKTIIIKRYKQLQKSFWERLKFLFKGV